MVLPRLLYLSDVPLEATHGGSVLLYRLLSEYPPELLCVLDETGPHAQPGRRLRDVAYQELPPRLTRLHNRYGANVRQLLLLASASIAPRAEALAMASRFRPDAVLSVAHGTSWLEAAGVAKRRGIPLHLVCHDDWEDTLSLPRLSLAWAEKTFATVYRNAESRLCVSPNMAEEYERRYHAAGVVLYPGRAADCPAYPDPSPRLTAAGDRFTVAFAGSPHASAVAQMQTMAQVLERVGGRLLVFGAQSPDALRDAGLTANNIELRPGLPSRTLIETLRAEADVLYLPMSFLASERKSAMLGFPAKFTDYTAVGLPILIHGPDYCSAVGWANEHPGAAAVVTEPAAAPLLAIVQRLYRDPDLRRALAVKAMEIGRQDFSAEESCRLFSSILMSAHGARQTSPDQTRRPGSVLGKGGSDRR
jgi:glycosyltransferase involved in cell wall biosynthesis